MGKGILIIVAGCIIGATVLMMSGNSTALETRENLSNYEHRVIARDAAESGFSQGLSVVQRELMSADDHITGEMAGAEYDIALSTNMYGDLDLQSVGSAGSAEEEVAGNVIFEVPVDAAALLSSDAVTLTMTDGSARISGSDVRSPVRSGSANEPGFLAPIYGVRTNSGLDADVRSSLAAAGAHDQVEGLGGENSVSGGFDTGFYDALFDEALDSDGESYYTEYFGPTTLSLDSDIGSPGEPRIVVVHGDATLSGDGNGFGLLLVNDGDLTFASDDATWEGLVFVRNGGGVSVDMSGGGSIYGGLMAFDYATGATVDECTPDFEISGDETIVNESFRTRIEVLGAAISMGAGGYDMPVTTQLKIGNETIEPWGPYGQALDGNLNRAGTFVFEPDVVYPPGSIKVNARSWKLGGSYTYEWHRIGWSWKKIKVWTGGDGSDNDDWDIHMEKNSDQVDNQLEVLEDGSPAPVVTGFDGQTSAAEFVAGYIDEGNMTLAKNQSIYLFELGVNDPGSAAHDFQDLVVIVTMVPASVASCASGASSTPNLALTMGNDARLTYSAEAIAKLGLRLDAVRSRTRVVVAGQKSSQVE